MGIQFDGINNEIKSQTKIDFPGSVGVAGTLTYEDVTNIDSVGIVTARTGIKIGPTAGVAGTFFADGSYVTAGIVTATTFHGSAANLTNIPAANITGTLPAISGANLTNLDASDLASGTVPTARLGSGTANSSTFLAGDSTYKTVSGTTINNNANNRIVTGSGTANTLEAETTLEWDGTNTLTVVNQGSGYPDFRFNTKTVAGGGEYELFRVSGGKFRIGSTSTTANSSADELLIGNGSNDRGLTIFGGTSNIYFGDSSDNDIGKLEYVHSDNSMRFTVNTAERLRIDSTGRISAGKHGVGTYNDASEWFKVQSNDSAANISIVGSNDTHSSLNLGDEDDFNIQKIRSDHSDNSLEFFTNNAERLRIKSDGKVIVTGGANTNSSYGIFQVNQAADNDEGGIAILNDADSRSMRLYCDASANSVINSGDGGGGRIVLNEGGGDVLIGSKSTGSEVGKLDIYHTSDNDINNPHIRLHGPANNDARIEFGTGSNSGEGGYIMYNDSDEALYIGSRMATYSEVNLCTGMNDGSPTSNVRMSVRANGEIDVDCNYGSTRAMYPCRAWANLSGDSSPATIRVSRGLSGVTDNGTGDYTFTFSSSFSDANYSALCSSAGDGGWSMVPHIYSHSDMNTNNVRFSINAVNVSGQNYDRDIFCMAIFR